MFFWHCGIFNFILQFKEKQMEFLSYLFFRLFVWFIGVLPFRFIYRLSDFTAFILYSVAGYRKKVVMDNLKASFPGKPKEELRRIAKATYRNLTDVMLEGIKVFTMNTDEILKRYRTVNPEVLSQPEYKEKSIITVSAHICNWEWGAFTLPEHTARTVVAFYKPLSNKYIDLYLRKNRERGNTILMSIEKTAGIVKHRNNKSVWVLIADQNPSNPHKAVWVNFFGRPTAFLPGPEILGKMYDLPVFFVEIRRLKRGLYEYEFHHLTDHPAQLKKGELTEMFARITESVIRKNPGNWLWTHRRWKHKTEDLKNNGNSRSLF